MAPIDEKRALNLLNKLLCLFDETLDMKSLIRIELSQAGSN